MVKLVDRAMMKTYTTGTGTTVSLDQSFAGFQVFSVAGLNQGDEFHYVIEDGTAWETGLGVMGLAQFERTLIDSSTGSLLDLTGNATVFVTVLASDMIIQGDVVDGGTY